MNWLKKASHLEILFIPFKSRVLKPFAFVSTEGNNVFYGDKYIKSYIQFKIVLYKLTLAHILKVYLRSAYKIRMTNYCGSFADLNPCKNTRIRIPDLRIRIRISNTETNIS